MFGIILLLSLNLKLAIARPVNITQPLAYEIKAMLQNLTDDTDPVSYTHLYLLVSE